MCEYCGLSPNGQSRHLIGCPNHTTPPIVKGIMAELEKEENKLDCIKSEKDDVLSFLAECRFLDFDTKDKLLSEYDGKILDSKENIRDYKSRLEEIQ